LPGGASLAGFETLDDPLHHTGEGARGNGEQDADFAAPLALQDEFDHLHLAGGKAGDLPLGLAPTEKGGLASFLRFGEQRGRALQQDLEVTAAKGGTTSRMLLLRLGHADTSHHLGQTVPAKGKAPDAFGISKARQFPGTRERAGKGKNPYNAGGGKGVR